MTTEDHMQYRVFKLAKDVEHPEEDQDAFRVDAARGLAAIADGVASAIFSRQWASILTEAVLADTPDPTDGESFARWLAPCRQAWQEQIDVSGLAWFQKAKLRQGAFSTLLWIGLAPADESNPPKAYRMAGFAIGDSCLFHIRQGRVIETFPVTTAAELDDNPLVVGSIDLGRDELLEFREFQAEYQPGDLIVLCTDAVAQWALTRIEQDDPPDWQRYWDMPEDDWRREISDLRADRQMRYDDATLLLLQMEDVRQAAEQPVEQMAEVAEPEEEQAASEQPGDRPPTPSGQDDWTKKLKSLSEQFTEQFSEQVSHGLDKMKEVTQSAEEVIKRYRDRWRD